MLSSFLAFAKLGTRKGLLRYGICAPCSKRLPPVRDAFFEAFGVKNRLLRYGRDIRCKKQPPMVRDAFSIKTFLSFLYATANPTVRETITRNSSTPTQMDVDGLGRGSFFPGTNISARPAPNANPYHKTAARTKATITPQDGTNARA